MLRKRMICLLLSAALIALSGCGGTLPETADVSSADKPAEPAQNKEEKPEAEKTEETAADNSEAEKPEENAADNKDMEEKTSEAEDKDNGEGEASDMNDSKYPLSAGITIPEIERKNYEVPDTEAMRFANSLKVGWILGNTLDAYDDGNVKDELSIETAWQKDKTTKEMIHGIKELGYSSIRIPVSWHNHVSGDVEISEAWLSRVDEIIGWAYDEGLYVIVNIHHDNHPEANGLYPDKAHLEQSKHYVERIWTQLSDRFEKYDEHLIFEGMNEPRLVGHEYEWRYALGNKDCKEAAECINELNQVFVDTVRASGGNNEIRYLMCPAYDASPDGALASDFHLPEDKEGVEGRIMLSIHAYTPYSFALESPGISNFDASDKASTQDIDTFMGKLYMKYIREGIPVVIGEFGCVNKNGNLQDRVDFTAYYVNAARQRGIPCLWWDNNLFTGSGELFGIYGRKDISKTTYDIVAAMMAYGD